jgi:hypothetical protein
VLLDRGSRGPALKDFDICGNRDGLYVFEVLVPGVLRPGQELLDCPVIGSPGVGVADRNRKKLKEFFPGGWSGARDDGWSCERQGL